MTHEKSQGWTIDRHIHGPLGLTVGIGVEGLSSDSGRYQLTPVTMQSYEEEACGAPTMGPIVTPGAYVRCTIR